MFAAKKLTKQDRGAKKVTQIDFQIELMERIGIDSELSQVEINQLNSLRERKVLMAKLGIENKATIVPKFPAKQLTNKAIKVKSSVGEQIKSNSVALKSSKDDQSREQVDPQCEEVIDNKILDSAGKKVSVIKKKSGQGFSSPFLHFVHKNKLELNKISPGASVNKATLRET